MSMVQTAEEYNRLQAELNKIRPSLDNSSIDINDKRKLVIKAYNKAYGGESRGGSLRKKKKRKSTKRRKATKRKSTKKRKSNKKTRRRRY